MRDCWARSAALAACGLLFFTQAAHGAVYPTPTRQKAAQSRAPAARGAPAPGQAATKAAAKPQATQRPAYTARPVATPIRKSNDMLALEALERAPVPVAPKRAPASAPKTSKPAAPQRSQDSIALDALVGSP